MERNSRLETCEKEINSAKRDYDTACKLGTITVVLVAAAAITGFIGEGFAWFSDRHMKKARQIYNGNEGK